MLFRQFNAEFAILPAEAYELVENRALLQRLLAMNIEAEKPRMAPSAIAEIVLSFFSGLCDLLGCCETLTSTVDTSVALFSFVCYSEIFSLTTFEVPSE